MSRFMMLVLGLILAASFAGCGDDDSGNGGDGDTDTDTDADTDTDTDTDTDADTDTDTDTDSDTDADGDYWVDGYCPGGDTDGWFVASTDCQDVVYEGCCDEAGNAIWCDSDQLFCNPCSAGSYVCSWAVNTDGSYYWCTDTDNGPDPSGTFPEDCGGENPDAGTVDAGK